MRLLLAGGGTAGHIEPALNLADVVSQRYPGADIALLGTERGMETRLVPARGYPLELIQALPMPRRVNRDLFATPAQVRRSVRSVREVIARRQSEVVVGFGGYVALPAYLGARGRVPIVVHEANAKAGLANRVGARLTPYVAQAVAGSLRGAQTLGIPLRPAIVDLDRASLRMSASAAFGLDPQRPCLLVFGGSQGARRINQAVADAASRIVAAGAQILHAVGPNNLDQVEGLELSLAPHYRPVPFIDRMDLAYSAADVAMCRSGAMTCAELSAVGLPAIYVPLPIGNGEQRLNAAPTVAAGGGVYLEDSQLSPDRVADAVIPLLGDPRQREKMAAAASALGVRDAGQQLADLVVMAIEGAKVS